MALNGVIFGENEATNFRKVSRHLPDPKYTIKTSETYNFEQNLTNILETIFLTVTPIFFF